MKKYLGLIICLLFMVPVIVKADMGGPSLVEYKAEVINPEGADIYDYDDNYNLVKTGEKIPYQKVITIQEWDDLGKSEYANVIGEKDAIVSLKDVRGLSNEYKYNLADFYKESESIILKDVEIKKGPANGFESTGVVIKKGTVVKTRENKIEGMDPWFYVEYNGTKGFICSLNASFTTGELEESVMVLDNIEIKDENENKIGTIPVNTILKSKVKTVDPWSRKYYVTYNGVTGLISVYDVAFSEIDKVTTNKKINVYKTARSNEVVGTIEKGETYTTKYVDVQNDGTRIYYKNGNVEGWIRCLVDEDGHDCDDYTLEYTNEKNNEPQEEVTSKPTEEEPQEVITPEKPASKNVVLFAAIGAVITFVTILVCIILINKKDKEA